MRKYKLSEIGKIVSGATPKTSEPTYYGGEIPWLTPADLSGYGRKYISHGSRNITQMGYDSCSTQIMPAGTVLFSSRAPIGYVAIAQNPICTNQGFKSIVPNENVNSEFLYYQLKYLRSQIQDMGSGTTFKEISVKKLGEVQVVLPELDEQERIVGRIEELFSELDNAVVTLEKAKRQLAVYRQAVLIKAFSEIPDVVDMGTLADMVDPQPSHRTPPEVAGGIPYIGIGDIDYEHNKINFSDSRKVAIAVLSEQHVRYTVRNGDFIMGKIGTIGKPFQLPLPQNYALSANVILIQPKQQLIIPEFLFLQFASPLVVKQLISGATATSQPAFGIKKTRKIKIRVCNIAKQEKLLSDINMKISMCDGIEKTIDAALQQALMMRHSILKQAFTEVSYDS